MLSTEWMFGFLKAGSIREKAIPSSFSRRRMEWRQPTKLSASLEAMENSLHCSSATDFHEHRERIAWNWVELWVGRSVWWTTTHWGEFWSCEKLVFNNDNICKNNNLSLMKITFQGFGLASWVSGSSTDNKRKKNKKNVCVCVCVCEMTYPLFHFQITQWSQFYVIYLYLLWMMLFKIVIICGVYALESKVNNTTSNSK